jgi:hypothetical protein
MFSKLDYFCKWCSLGPKVVPPGRYLLCGRSVDVECNRPADASGRRAAGFRSELRLRFCRGILPDRAMAFDSGHEPRWKALGLAIVFLTAAVAMPKVLRPLNYVWFRIGRLLHRVVSPLIMGAVFFLCILPIGMLMRMAGKDLLRLKWSATLNSYWIVREPLGPDPRCQRCAAGFIPARRWASKQGWISHYS